jgi:hypothetical protein
VTDEGRAFWSVAPQLVAQVRTAGMGQIIGLDVTACLAVTDAAGIDREAALIFVRGLEAGLLRAMALRGADGQQNL